MGLRGRGWKLGEHADVSGDGPILPQAGTYCYISQLQLTLLQRLPSGSKKTPDINRGYENKPNKIHLKLNENILNFPKFP